MDEHKSDKHGTRTIQRIVGGGGNKLNDKIENSDCTVRKDRETKFEDGGKRY